MSRAKVRRTKSKSRRVKAEATEVSAETLAASMRKQNLKFHRFIGVALGGGKTDRTCLSVIEYYPDQQKIFLSRLFDKIKTDGDISADWQIHKLITKCPPPVESVSFDVPLALPICTICPIKCPGYELCQEPHILWMWKHYRSMEKKKSPPRLFTPYTERCVEQFINSEMEEPFNLSHAMGSNLAPLTARAQFLTRRLRVKALEVFPKLSLWRMGNALNMPKSNLRFHRHWESGQSSRQLILNKMMDKSLAFIYD